MKSMFVLYFDSEQVIRCLPVRCNEQLLPAKHGGEGNCERNTKIKKETVCTARIPINLDIFNRYIYTGRDWIRVWASENN